MQQPFCSQPVIFLFSASDFFFLFEMRKPWNLSICFKIFVVQVWCGEQIWRELLPVLQKRGGTPCHTRPCREAPDLSGNTDSKGKQRQESLLWFPQEGVSKARYAGSGLASLSYLRRVRAVPSCLVPSAVVMREGGPWPRA